MKGKWKGWGNGTTNKQTNKKTKAGLCLTKLRLYTRRLAGRTGGVEPVATPQLGQPAPGTCAHRHAGSPLPKPGVSGCQGVIVPYPQAVPEYWGVCVCNAPCLVGVGGCLRDRGGQSERNTAYWKVIRACTHPYSLICHLRLAVRVRVRDAGRPRDGLIQLPGTGGL